MPSDKDIVIEARELLARLPKVAYNLIENDTIFNFYLAAPDLLRALADEVERLQGMISEKDGLHVVSEDIYTETQQFFPDGYDTADELWEYAPLPKE